MDSCIGNVIDYDCAYKSGVSHAAEAYYRGGDEGKRIGTDKIFDEYPALRNFCDFLDQTINHMNHGPSISSGKKGAPFVKINLLFAFWGFIWIGYLKRPKSLAGHIDWHRLINVFEWFWHRLGKYELYGSLKPNLEFLDPEYFKNQFYKQRDRNARIFKHCGYTPARQGFFLWLGMRRPFIYHWSEIASMDLPNYPKVVSRSKLDDKKRAIEMLRKALDGKEKFVEAVMFPDLTYTID